MSLSFLDSLITNKCEFVKFHGDSVKSSCGNQVSSNWIYKLSLKNSGAIY